MSWYDKDVEYIRQLAHVKSGVCDPGRLGSRPQDVVDRRKIIGSSYSENLPEKAVR